MQQKKKSVRVALLGAPRAGKSSIAAQSFAILREEGLPVELVSEFAREFLAANETIRNSYEQAFLASEQSRREETLALAPCIVVSDSPLLINWTYAGLLNGRDGRKGFSQDGRSLMMEMLYRSFLQSLRDYDLVLFVEAPKAPVVSDGDGIRIHTPAESVNIERIMLATMDLHGGADFVVKGHWDFGTRARFVADKIRKAWEDGS